MWAMWWLFILSTCVVPTFSMEGFIVGGQDEKIENVPHSVLAKIQCTEGDDKKASYTCGSSILNQQILLSAAHCLYGCTASTTVGLFIGTAIAKGEPTRQSYGFVIHQRYNPKSFDNDIMLLILREPLKLNNRVRRVALMKKPPYFEPAVVAGWGLVNEVDKVKAERLKSVVQTVWSTEECESLLHNVQGTFCASAENEGYASMGDSGSALVVRGFIQIGIVSYKLPTITKEVLIYTDVGYFYNWIKTYSKHVFCSYENKIIE